MSEALLVGFLTCLLSVFRLSITIKSFLGDFLVISSKDNTLRVWMMKTYATALEDERAEIRRAACRALSTLEAKECIQELVHIVECDPSSIVKSEAKETLLTMGKCPSRSREAALREVPESSVWTVEWRKSTLFPKFFRQHT